MKRILDRAVDFFLAMLIIGMTAVIFVSVFWRYALNSPLSWVEEVARLMVVWMCFVGAYMALRERKHIGFDIIVARLPAAVRRVIDAVNQVLTITFLVVVIWQGVVFAGQFLTITMPYTGISQGWFAYSVFPVSGALMLLQSILNFATDLKKGDK